MRKHKRFQGTATALVTPFKTDGSLDEKSLRRLVDFQIRGGVEGLVPVGTTGENPTLNAEEQRRVIEIVLDQTDGRAGVFAGTGTNDTKETIRKSREAKQLGVDALLVVGPYYNKPTQEGYFQHYRTIAEAVDIPIIIYNVPGRTGGNIEAATTLRLAEEVENIAMVKEASANFSQIMEIARNRPEGFSVLSGDDALALPIMSVGGDGCISVVANEVPKEFAELIRHCLKGNWAKALRLHNRLLPLMNLNFVESNPIPVKTVLAMMGMIEEAYRLPMVPIGETNRRKLRDVARELRLVK